MAIPFKNPDPNFVFIPSKEKSAITKHFKKRQVPVLQPGRLLLATWNIANLGAQNRSKDALKIIAHILKRFDLIAIQEVNAKFGSFITILKHMGSAFDYVMSDTAGNSERLAFIYRKSKVSVRNLFGEVALRKHEYPKRTVTVHYTYYSQKKEKKYEDVKFIPFDRNPFIGSFRAGIIDFTLVNTHLYFGKFQNSSNPENHKKYCRRVLEIFALSKWASRRTDKTTTYDKDILLLGDMNVPSMEPTESTYKALTHFGMLPINYLTKTGGTNLGNDKTYDQMAFAPGSIDNKILDYGVFDFDNAVFSDLWQSLSNQNSQKKAISKFNGHVKHHFSDHRPVWVELDIN